ncbi:uncharacterized protein B0H18DRAFT_1034545 [Fomitopsis serialis]|uniref:uncharacterized protein n=1 Tax=Fomitopsis serialis TaxID=139415 RepID=UPI0020075FE8|nr:uncharacterized protein B0H18DRAFT_1034545 [Neoantrodia serialis]KAH9917417.1 hypothetical protein B0H18DRAFT_1034545 [Neoantrodia serialis]
MERHPRRTPNARSTSDGEWRTSAQYRTMPPPSLQPVLIASSLRSPRRAVTRPVRRQLQRDKPDVHSVVHVVHPPRVHVPRLLG